MPARPTKRAKAPLTADEREGIILAVSSAFRKLKNLYTKIVPIFEDFGFTPPSAGVIARDLSEKIEKAIIQHCESFTKGSGHCDLSRFDQDWEVKICKDSGLTINQSKGDQWRELHRRELQSELDRESDLDSVGRSGSVFLAAPQELERSKHQSGRRRRKHRSDLRFTPDRSHVESGPPRPARSGAFVSDSRRHALSLRRRRRRGLSAREPQNR